jgi:hypothetical protein
VAGQADGQPLIVPMALPGPAGRSAQPRLSVATTSIGAASAMALDEARRAVRITRPRLPVHGPRPYAQTWHGPGSAGARARLAIIDALTLGDSSPGELSAALGMQTTPGRPPHERALSRSVTFSCDPRGDVAWWAVQGRNTSCAAGVKGERLRHRCPSCVDQDGWSPGALCLGRG